MSSVSNKGPGSDSGGSIGGADGGQAETRLVHAGRDPEQQFGIVNPAVWHASTVLFPTVQALEERTREPFEGVYYGRYGTPTTFALEEAVAELEGGYRAITAASGQSALTTALMAATRAGDHVLLADSVYGPTRGFVDTVLSRFGVHGEFYDPRIGAGIAGLIRPNTAAVYLESPGSLTFEVQDVPAIVAAVRSVETPARPITILADNTWATPLFFKPLRHGVNVVIHAATKYIVGHSDAMLGMIVCDRDNYLTVRRMAVRLGTCAGPDDVYLALRGLRTLAVRLNRHRDTGLALAAWLAEQPEVVEIYHPAWPGSVDHALWQRDFTGASGLFAVRLSPCSKPALAAMLDRMTLFKMGYSWGGFESLILPVEPHPLRTATRWTAPGPVLRLHAGLEAVPDLIADLAAGFERLRAVQ